MVFNGADAQPDDYDPTIMNGFHFVTDTFADGVLIDWLKHCPKVSELRLVMPIAPFVNWRVEFKDVLGDLYLKNLVLLQVSNIQGKSEELVRCLLQHKDTLRELDLAFVHLSSGDWPACISSFAGKLPHLRRARMNGRLTGETGDEPEEMTTCFLSIPQAKKHQAELEKYIFEGTGPMPTWPDSYLDDDELEYDEEDEDEDDDVPEDDEESLEEDDDSEDDVQDDLGDESDVSID
jgi:hypothetical protein